MKVLVGDWSISMFFPLKKTNIHFTFWMLYLYLYLYVYISLYLCLCNPFSDCWKEGTAKSARFSFFSLSQTVLFVVLKRRWKGWERESNSQMLRREWELLQMWKEPQYVTQHESRENYISRGEIRVTRTQAPATQAAYVHLHFLFYFFT